MLKKNKIEGEIKKKKKLRNILTKKSKYFSIKNHKQGHKLAANARKKARDIVPFRRVKHSDVLWFPGTFYIA